MRYLSYLYALILGQRLHILLCCLTGVVGVAFSLCFIYVTKQVIDAAASGRPFLQPALYAAGLLLLQLVFAAWHQWLTVRLQVMSGNALRHRLFERLLRVEGQEVENLHSGDVMNRMEQDSAAISTLITATLPLLVVTLVQLLAAFLFFCWLDPTLPWIVAGILPLMLPAGTYYMKRMKRFTHSIRQSDSQIQSVIQESLQHRSVVKSLEQTDRHIQQLDLLQETLQQQVDQRTRFSLVSRSLLAAIFSGGYLTAFLWGAYRLSQSSITFGTMTAFLQLVGKVQRPVIDLSRMVPSVVNALTAVDRLLELEALAQEEQGHAVRFAEVPRVEFQDVTFAYGGQGVYVLHHFSCRIPAGSITAIVGETGRGKTTLLRLLLALIKPESGTIRLVGSDGRVEAVSPLTRCNFVYVPQGNTLFSGTIRENLRMGCPEASDEAMRVALHTAVADFVLQLPHGLDTHLNELGNGLSEGQSQRIAIARALLRPGGILLLDEASSALDAATEHQLMTRLRSASHGKTILFVTHHAAIIDSCDQKIEL